MRLQLQVTVTGNATQTLNATATAVGNVGKQAKGANNEFRGLISTIRDIRTVLAVIQSARMFTNLIREGMEFNALLETSLLGLTAIITTFTEMTDATGRHLSMMERYTVSQKLAADLQEKMKVSALQTTLQYDDLLNVMQRGLPYILKYMTDINGNIPSNKKIIDFTTAFSQGAHVFGLHPNEIGGNIRALLQGTANDRTFRFANALLKDIGTDPEKVRAQLKLWREQGVLYEELTKRIAAFKQAGIDMMETYSGKLSNFKDAVQQALGEGTKKATSDMTDLFGQMTDAIVRIDTSGKKTFDPTFIEAIKNTASAFVVLANVLAKVASLLALVMAHSGNPNIKNLGMALGGAVAGGVVGGPWGALLGASAMYFSGNVQDDIKKEREAAIAERERLKSLGERSMAEVTGRGGIVANGTWGRNQEGMYQQFGRVREELGEDRWKFFAKELKSQTRMVNDGFGGYPELNRLDFLKTRKKALEFDPMAEKIKSTFEEEVDFAKQAEKTRKAALALEQYRDTLESIERQLDRSKMKSSLDAVSDSFDELAAKTTDPFELIDIEKEKANVKALNDWAAEISRIDKLQDDLNDAKSKAALSKTKPEDIEKEARIQVEINNARLAADTRYRAEVSKNNAEAGEKTLEESKKLTEDREKWVLERVKLAYREHLETGVSMQEAINRATVEPTTEAWENHYANRLKMEEKLVARIKELYAGVVDSIKNGMREVVGALIDGSGDPFGSVLQGFRNSWEEYLGSITDNFLSMVQIMAAGSKDPYRFTERGERGENDPGGQPVYATKRQTFWARIGMGTVQSAAALYGIYQNQGAMGKNTSAVSGAIQGANAGMMFGPYGAVAGAVVGGIAGYATGGQKVGYEVTAKGGKISVRALGKGKAADAAQAERDINAAILTTRGAAMDVLLSFPAAVLAAIADMTPDQVIKDGVYGPQAPEFKSKTTLGKIFDLNPALKAFRKKVKQEVGGLTGEGLREFIENEIPEMIFQAYAPVFRAGLEVLGVTKAKLSDIFSRAEDPGFDPKAMIQRLQDYVNVIVGLQEVTKFLNVSADNGSGWNMKAEEAVKQLNPTPFKQISDLDAKIQTLADSMSEMDWEEQVQAGKTLLGLAQERVQIEMQALAEMRNTWLAIEKSVKGNISSIEHDWVGNPDWSIHKYRGAAVSAMNNLLGLMDNPDATADQVQQYADEAQQAAMSLYQTMKSRYDEEMSLISKIEDTITNVAKSFEEAKFAIEFDQMRKGYDENGNPIYDKKKQADAILAQQRDLFDQLKVAATPEEVARISGEIQRNAGRLYDLWGSTPEAAKQALKQMTDAGNIAAETLARLKQEAQTRADEYRLAATEAINILKATADIANAVIAGMQARLQATDPAVYASINAALGTLTTTVNGTDDDLGDFGGALRRTREDLDAFGTALVGWTRKFDGSGGNVNSPATVSSNSEYMPRSGGAPVIILNGSMAAVADHVEVRIGNKIYQRAISTMQKRTAGSSF